MNNRNKLYKITLAAMFAALTCVATAFLIVPLPGSGYAHFGDCFVILSGLVLGPVYGAAAAGIGSAFADLFVGFGMYAPATLIIKALMAVAASLLYKAIKKIPFRYKFIPVAIAVSSAEAVMLLGYFVFEIFLYAIAVATANLLGSAIQGLVGLVSGTILFSVLNKTGLISKL